MARYLHYLARHMARLDILSLAINPSITMYGHDCWACIVAFHFHYLPQSDGETNINSDIQTWIFIQNFLVCLGNIVLDVIGKIP